MRLTHAGEPRVTGHGSLHMTIVGEKVKAFIAGYPSTSPFALSTFSESRGGRQYWVWGEAQRQASLVGQRLLRQGWSAEGRDDFG